MKSLLLLAIVVASVYLCEARKHHKHKDKQELIPTGPSANPYHLGSKHHRGRERFGKKHIQFVDSLGKHHDIKSLHDGWMTLPKGSECKKTKCGHKELCIANPHTGDEKCISRRNFKEGRRLFRSFHKRKELLKGDEKDNKQMYHLKSELSSAEHMKEVYELVSDYKKAGKHHDHHKHLSAKQVDSKDDVKSIFDIKNGPQLREAAIHSTQECRPTELYELRKRMTSWFVLLHTESRQKHHRRFHHKGHKKHLKKKFGKLSHDKLNAKFHNKHTKDVATVNTIESESHGHCKCSKSIMWEFRKQDHNENGHLSHEEIANMESNRREPCMKPLLKSCDKHKDGLITRGEWCCCFAHTIAPCAEKKRLVDPKDWVPRCDKEGYYHREQCHKGSGYCWCVDINGNTIHGTKKLGEAHCGKYDPNGQLIKE